jgi:hypothetical protein
MKIYLISSKDRIISPAIKSFSQERRFELQICEGIFLQPDGNYASLVDFKKSRLRLGREITVPEIGIALAHCAVYKKLVIEGLNWAMVLEDDAMLVNQELLINQINQIERVSTSQPTIFLLFHHDSSKILGDQDGHFTKSNSVPSYALAYILNTSAAKLLIKAQEPITSVADWPLTPNEVTYWLSNECAFTHGSEIGSHNSYLAGTSRAPKSSLQKWMWITGIDLVRFRTISISNLCRHFYFVIQPRLSRFKSSRNLKD